MSGELPPRSRGVAFERPREAAEAHFRKLGGKRPASDRAATPDTERAPVPGPAPEPKDD